MVFAGIALTNGGLHETGERGEDVDGWVDTTVVEGAVDEDLTFGDVASQVRYGMCDIWSMLVCALFDCDEACLPSLGMVRIGICVIEPLRPSTRPARS